MWVWILAVTIALVSSSNTLYCNCFQSAMIARELRNIIRMILAQWPGVICKAYWNIMWHALYKNKVSKLWFKGDPLNYLPASEQSVPLYPSTQLHSNHVSVSRHVPPLIHGLVWHGSVIRIRKVSMSCWHFAGSKQFYYGTEFWSIRLYFVFVFCYRFFAKYWYLICIYTRN